MLRRTLLPASIAAFVLALSAAPGAAQLQYSDQGSRWEPARQDWYSRTQGSRLMPLTWLRALERADSSDLFLTPANIARYRYIFDAAGATNLPIGFTEDRQSDERFRYTKLRWLARQGSREPWVGLNCAACHTSEITAGTNRLRVDGAPGMGDYQLFNEELVAAMEATRAQPDKLARFIARIPGANPQALTAAITEWLRYRRQVEAMNDTPIRYGFARFDAFGHIFNQASLFTQAPNPTANPSNAPVSYPFLWNVPQQNRLQWNGSVPKDMIGDLDVGAVGRNFGEVVGVYGEVITRRHPGASGPRIRLPAILPFRSSVNVANLIWLERQLRVLQPPAWPEAFLINSGVRPQAARIDPAAQSRGAILYRDKCSTCHQVIPRDNPPNFQVQMSYFETPLLANGQPQPNTPPGTDPFMACNAAFRTAETGNLFYYQIGNGQRAGRVEPVISILTITVKQGLEDHAWDLLRGIIGRRSTTYSAPPSSAGQPLLGATESTSRTSGAALYPATLPDFYKTCVSTVYRGDPMKNILGYKARPLNGVWATAPYLHNGSVPTLYDLLLPPDDRPREFYVGSREFDPRKVGYVTGRSDTNSFPFRTHQGGQPIWGNWNGGHDYGNARLSDRDRWDLVEYMKGL